MTNNRVAIPVSTHRKVMEFARVQGITKAKAYEVIVKAGLPRAAAVIGQAMDTLSDMETSSRKGNGNESN